MQLMNVPLDAWLRVETTRAPAHTPQRMLPAGACRASTSRIADYRLKCVDPLNNSAFSPSGRQKKPWLLARWANLDSTARRSKIAGGYVGWFLRRRKGALRRRNDKDARCMLSCSRC
jgi:hypothetical protein